MPEIAPTPPARSRYSLVVLAAKRTKQIREGAPVLIETESTNTLTIALEEIAAGKVNSTVVEEPVDGEGGKPSRMEASASPASPFLVDGYEPETDEGDADEDAGAADEDSMDRESGNDGEE